MNKYMSRNRSTTVKKYSKLLKEDRLGIYARVRTIQA